MYCCNIRRSSLLLSRRIGDNRVVFCCWSFERPCYMCWCFLFNLLDEKLLVAASLILLHIKSFEFSQDLGVDYSGRCSCSLHVKKVLCASLSVIMCSFKHFTAARLVVRGCIAIIFPCYRLLRRGLANRAILL